MADAPAVKRRTATAAESLTRAAGARANCSSAGRLRPSICARLAAEGVPLPAGAAASRAGARLVRRAAWRGAAERSESSGARLAAEIVALVAWPAAAWAAALRCASLVGLINTTATAVLSSASFAARLPCCPRASSGFPPPSPTEVPRVVFIPLTFTAAVSTVAPLLGAAVGIRATCEYGPRDGGGV